MDDKFDDMNNQFDNNMNLDNNNNFETNNNFNNNENQIGENIMKELKNYGIANNYNDAILKLSILILPISFFTSFERIDLWSILNVVITIGILKQKIPIKYSQYLFYSMCLNLIIEIVWTFLNLGNLTEGILFFLNIIFNLLEIFIQIVILLLYWKEDFKNVKLNEIIKEDLNNNNETENSKIESSNDNNDLRAGRKKDEKKRINPADIKNTNSDDDKKNILRNFKEEIEP
jgi:hypothetical protein